MMLTLDDEIVETINAVSIEAIASEAEGLKTETIAAIVINDRGDMLPYTVQSTVQQAEEAAKERWPCWEQLKEKGAKVVQVKLTCTL